MKIYNYDRYTGLLLGESNAQKSPKEKDVFLVPANATKIKPTGKLEGKERFRFIDGVWHKENFYTGDKFYDPNNDYSEIILNGFCETEGLLQEIPESVLAERQHEEDAKTAKSLILKEISEKKKYLFDSDYKSIKHQEELCANRETTLSESEFCDFLTERQVARDRINELEQEIGE